MLTWSRTSAPDPLERFAFSTTPMPSGGAVRPVRRRSVAGWRINAVDDKSHRVGVEHAPIGKLLQPIASTLCLLESALTRYLVGIIAQHRPGAPR